MAMQRAAQCFIETIGEVCRETLYINRRYWQQWHQGCDCMCSSCMPCAACVPNIFFFFGLLDPGAGVFGVLVFGASHGQLRTPSIGLTAWSGRAWCLIVCGMVGQGVMLVSVCMGGSTRRAFTARPSTALAPRMVHGLQRHHAADGILVVPAGAAAAAAAASASAAAGTAGVVGAAAAA